MEAIQRSQHADERGARHTVRMFESDWLEACSRTHPSVVALVWGPVVMALAWLGHDRGLTAAAQGALFISGVTTWTLAEYWLHRSVFHWQPKGAWGPRLHFLLHGVHHGWPRDRLRLVMPLGVSVPLFFACLALSYWGLGSQRFASFYAGVVLGYLAYDLTHYHLHHGRPRTRFGRALRRHHMLHHFADAESRFGVSSPLWDWVFGTAGRSRVTLSARGGAARPPGSP